MQKEFWIYDKWNNDDCIGKLIYYLDKKEFMIEIAKDLDPLKAPVIFDYFISKDEYTVPPYWAMRWVQERIIPPNRQGLGFFLKNMNLEFYDEYEILIFNNGRYAHDGCYLVPVDDKKEMGV